MKKIVIVLLILLLMSGCNVTIHEEISDEDSSYDFNIKDAYNNVSYSNGVKYIELGNENINITSAGEYLLKGNLVGSIIIDVSKEDMVHLFLNGVDINSNDFASIYVKEADKVVVTLLEDSVNNLCDESDYNQIDENDVDGLIFSKGDLIINGSGTLNVNTNNKHGIVSKDDLVINGGTINVVSKNQGIAGKDCVKIYDGNININCGTDAIKSDNDEDENKGYVYIAGGNIVIENADDAIQGYRLIEVVDGYIDIKNSFEGFEAQYININGGTININSSDDGMNATDKTNTQSGFGFNEDASIQINNGTIYINADGDGLDSNGTIYLNGGSLIVDGPSSSGNCAFDFETGGYAMGGSALMIGSSSMAEAFSDDSTGCNLLYCFDKNYEAGTNITITDGSDNIIFEHTSIKPFSCIQVTSLSFSVEDTITITIDEDIYTYTLDSITNSNSRGGMMPNGQDQHGNRLGRDDNFEMGDFDPSSSERPEIPEEEIPEDMPEKPVGDFPVRQRNDRQKNGT